MHKSDNPCPNERTSLDLISDKEAPVELKHHIEQCPHCSQYLRSLRAIDAQIKHSARPVPSRKQKRMYHRELENRLENLMPSRKQAPYFLKPVFAGLATLFVFAMGLWLGKLIWQPDQQRSDTTHIAEITDRQTEWLEHYLEQSEIWLLTVSNRSDNASVKWEAGEVFWTQQLLQQTYQIEKQFINHPLLIPFLEHLETMMLDLANADATEIESTFALIRTSIVKYQLLMQAENIQKQLINSSEEKSVSFKRM